MYVFRRLDLHFDFRIILALAHCKIFEAPRSLLTRPHPEIKHFAPGAGRIFRDGKQAGRTEYEKSNGFLRIKMAASLVTRRQL